MKNRHPILSIDLEDNLDPAPQISDFDIPFDMKGFNAVLSSTLDLDLAKDIHEKAGQNIAQQKQQRDYNLRHSLPTSVAKNYKVWLKNQRRAGRKGGGFSFKWTGPYTDENISKIGLCSLRDKRGHVHSENYNFVLLKRCLDPLNPPNVEPDQTTVSRNEPGPERIPSKDELDRQTPDVEERSENDPCKSDDPQDDAKSTHWNKLPDEVVEMILPRASSISHPLTICL